MNSKKALEWSSQLIFDNSNTRNYMFQQKSKAETLENRISKVKKVKWFRKGHQDEAINSRR